jgi:hypothetical protein
VTPLLALLACREAPEPEEETLAPEVWPVEVLWTDLVEATDRLTLGPVVVSSPRTRDGRMFFGADPAGGPRSGVGIVLGAVLSGWPPPVGTELTLTVTVVRPGEAPLVELLEESDAQIVALPVHPEGQPPAPFPYSDDPELQFALAAAPALTVTSRPDPLGCADTDGDADIGGRFGISPGWGRTGDLTGIVAEGRLHARTAADWTGALQGDPPLVSTLPELGALPEGTPVLLQDLALATPWSRDGRWAVLQDAQGQGIWLDAEAWGLPSLTTRGDTGTWTAEVRGDLLRIWDPPQLQGTRAPLLTDPWRDGALVTLSAQSLSPPDPYGERITDQGLILDDRFLDLSPLSPPLQLTGAVRIEENGPPWLAPTD